MTDVLIAVMTQSYAADIVTWRYPPPYDCYDMTTSWSGPSSLRTPPMASDPRLTWPTRRFMRCETVRGRRGKTLPGARVS